MFIIINNIFKPTWQTAKQAHRH